MYHIDIAAKRKVVVSTLDEIKCGVEGLNDSDALDRILALLTQASASIKAAVIPVEYQPQRLEKKDHFFPTQKNETQLKFMKTTANPGRKPQNIPLR